LILPLGNLVLRLRGDQLHGRHRTVARADSFILGLTFIALFPADRRPDHAGQGTCRRSKTRRPGY
jgi:hypothetical protein